MNKMYEIGGYFGLEQLISNEFYKDLLALNSARNALLYILKARKVKKLYIPYYLCDSVNKLCDREGYDYSYYKIGRNFLPDFDTELRSNEYIYIVNYFGQINTKTILRLKEKYKRVILDNVQAFFQRPIDGIDTIYSCRKYFGVPDGAYLSTTCDLGEELEMDISRYRIQHLLGRFETDSASTYYNDYKNNEASFDGLRLMKMSKITRNIMGAINYDKIREIRERNYQVLDETLSEKNLIPIQFPIAPFTYPLFCENGITVRKKLSEKKIFVPTLWPNVYNSMDKTADCYAKNIIMLPCDQRYSASDMKSVISEVLQCIE